MRTTLFISLLVLALTQRAFAEEYNSSLLASLLASNKPLAAYNYASQYAFAQEGNPDFDVYYGIAAIDAGYASQGVFALERVLSLRPDDQLIRLELARGYFVLEEYERSKQEFTAVMASNPSANVKQNIERYLRAITIKQGRYQISSRGSVRLAFGNDDNVNNGPSDLIIDIPLLGTAILNEQSRAQDDSYNRVIFDYQLDVPLSPGWSFYASTGVDNRSHSEQDAFDSLILAGNFGFRHYSGDSRYQVSLLAQQFDLDGDEYRSLSGLGFEWSHRLSTLSSLRIYSQIANLEYPAQSIRDSMYTTLGTGYTKQFNTSTATLLFTNLYFGAESADDSSNSAQAVAERDIIGLSIGTGFSFGPKLSFNAVISTQSSEYAGFDLFFQTEREDDYSALNLTFKWLITQNWSLNSNLMSSQNSSNIAINDYERSELSVNLMWQFQ